MENSEFKKVAGGYEKKLDKNKKIFIPDICVEAFDAESGEIKMHAPKYEEKEPSQTAQIGINAFQYETQEAPADCDFELSIGHYGDNYLTPLKDNLEIKGRGIRKLDERYRVTDLALEKLKKQYKISYEMMFD